MAGGERAAEQYDKDQVDNPADTPDSVEAAREKVRRFNEKHAERKA